MHTLSRRHFALLAAGGALAYRSELISRAEPLQTQLTAQQIVDKVRQNVGVAWKAETVDAFKAGDPTTVVKGIVATAMPTLDVLKQAVSRGANFVITCEPTFYSRADSAAPPRGRGGGPDSSADLVYRAKNDFIKNNELVIWRFSDHWRQRKPDPFVAGLAESLGWSRLAAAADPSRITLPAVKLEALASDLKQKLNARGGIRVVGDPQLQVTRVGLLPGTTAIQAALTLLPNVDAVVAGEVREWESVEYARDKITAGEKKALILVGRIVSENAGMNECAKWLKTIVPQVTTTWIPVGDPYWRPV